MSSLRPSRSIGGGGGTVQSSAPSVTYFLLLSLAEASTPAETDGPTCRLRSDGGGWRAPRAMGIAEEARDLGEGDQLRGAVTAGLDIEVGVERERAVNEGKYHQGNSAVVQVVARKRGAFS